MRSENKIIAFKRDFVDSNMGNLILFIQNHSIVVIEIFIIN